MAVLVIVRHGQSMWNQLNEFTGWVDVPITKQGEEEAHRAAKLLFDIPFDVAFTSQLIRAQQTLCVIFQERPDHLILVFKHQVGKESAWEHYTNAKSFEIPVFKSAQLNERYYGNLQGLNKQDTINKYGESQVHLWRRSYDVAPPDGESLKDVITRTIPYYQENIVPFLKEGKNVIIVAHGNSLRAIMMHLENLTPEQVSNLELPTGVPVCYEMNAEAQVVKKTVLE